MTKPHDPLEWNQAAPAPPDKADDLVERLRQKIIDGWHITSNVAENLLRWKQRDARDDVLKLVDDLRAKLATAETERNRLRVKHIAATEHNAISKQDAVIARVESAMYADRPLSSIDGKDRS